MSSSAEVTAAPPRPAQWPWVVLAGFLAIAGVALVLVVANGGWLTSCRAMVEYEPALYVTPYPARTMVNGAARHAMPTFGEMLLMSV